MDWAITATIITIVLASITAIGVWLGPKWAESARRNHEVRQSHLARLKNGVIRPLLNQLTHYYLPICVDQRSNIIGKSVLVGIPNAPLTKFNMDIQTKLKVISIDDIVEEWQEEDMMRDFNPKPPIKRDSLVIDDELYEDLRGNHEAGLVEKWESFVSKFTEYNELCLKHVENIAHQLVEESKVPDWTTQELQGGLRRGVNAAGVASFVWTRQLSLNSDWFNLRETANNFQLSSSRGEVMAMGTESEMSNLLTVADKLVDEKNKVSELHEIKTQMKIEEMADSVLRELKNFELSNRLRGSCHYIKI